MPHPVGFGAFVPSAFGQLVCRHAFCILAHFLWIRELFYAEDAGGSMTLGDVEENMRAAFVIPLD